MLVPGEISPDSGLERARFFSSTQNELTIQRTGMVRLTVAAYNFSEKWQTNEEKKKKVINIIKSKT